MGTVGESTKTPCDRRRCAGELAFLDRGNSVRIRNHAFNPWGQTREYQMDSPSKRPHRFSIGQTTQNDVTL